MTKHKLFKLGAAAALTVTGVSSATSLKTVRAANFTAIKQVKISYLPGKGLNIWTNYQNGKFMGYRAKDGTVWNVAETAVDKKGNLWYKVGTKEWIEARYTTDVTQTSTTSTTKTAVKTKKKATLTNLASKVKKAAKTTKKVTDTKKKTTATTKIAATKTDTTKSKKAKVEKAKKIVDATVKKNSKTASTQAAGQTSAIVALAKEQVGKSYAWGGDGPDTFDCSGLVQYVYQHAAGISVPRTTYDQVKVGQTVSMDELQPGDLIFWGSETAPYHVAIYVGNNQYVNAATPEQGTVLQTLSSYYYPTIAKRIL